MFNSMVNGAGCVVDRNSYLEERFQDGRELVFFDLSHPQQLAMDVKWLLEHEEMSASIAKSGCEATMYHDTWGERLESFLCLVE